MVLFAYCVYITAYVKLMSAWSLSCFIIFTVKKTVPLLPCHHHLLMLPLGRAAF